MSHHYRVLKDIPPDADGFRPYVIPAGADAWFEHAIAVDLIASGHIFAFEAAASSVDAKPGAGETDLQVATGLAAELRARQSGAGAAPRAGETDMQIAERLSAELRAKQGSGGLLVGGFRMRDSQAELKLALEASAAFEKRQAERETASQQPTQARAVRAPAPGKEWVRP